MAYNYFITSSAKGGSSAGIIAGSAPAGARVAGGMAGSDG
jgi:hypothetical protein